MLPGFPKRIETKKLGRGHYVILREDGYSIVVRKNPRGGWYQVGNGSTRPTLRTFKTDMAFGYMAKDQLEGGR